MEQALKWAGEHALELVSLAVALVVGIPTLIYARRGWERQRNVVKITVREPVRSRKRYGELQGVQLHLVADYRALRNDTYIHGARLVAGQQKVPGRDVDGKNKTAIVKVGTTITRLWPATDLRHLSPDKTWKVCWYDAESKGGCGDVPREYARMMVEDRLEAEASPQ